MKNNKINESIYLNRKQVITLLNYRSKAVTKSMHKEENINFQKGAEGAIVTGSFTANSIMKTIEANAIDTSKYNKYYVIFSWERWDRLHNYVIEFDIKKLKFENVSNQLISYRNGYDNLYSKGNIEKGRKEAQQYAIICLWSDPKEQLYYHQEQAKKMAQLNIRYKLTEVYTHGIMHDNNIYIGKLHLINNNKAYIYEVKYKKHLKGSENDLIDKNGYITGLYREELNNRLETYKSNKRAEEAKQYNKTADKCDLLCLYNDIMRKLQRLATDTDYTNTDKLKKYIDSIRWELSDITSAINGIDQNKFTSMESYNNRIKEAAQAYIKIVANY